MKYTKEHTIQANPGFAIFFDNVRVDKFVKDYTVKTSMDGSIGSAVINMCYVPDFDKIIHPENKGNENKQPEQPKTDTPATDDKTTTVTVTKGTVYNVGSKNLNVRSGPGTNHKIIGKLKSGATVTIKSESSGWYKIDYSGKDGWCSSQYMKKSTTTQTSSQSRTTSSTSKQVEAHSLGSSNLNIRSGPSTSYKVVTKIKQGTKCPFSEKKSGWYKVTANGKTGWGSGQYLKEVGGSPTSPEAPTETPPKLEDQVIVSSDDGIENMTNVRIYVRNVFTDLYVLIFDGNIRSKSSSYSNGGYTLTFQAEDYMNWLNRTICPIAVPFDGTLAPGDRLRWKAQGIDLNKVKTVTTVNDITFKGKNISQVWQEVSNQTIKANKLYSETDSVAAWDNPLGRVVVMGDIDKKLQEAEVVDFMITTSATSVNTIYVLMNDILKVLMFEFYQDRDGTIRIKPPFWNEHVLRSHVIDASLILTFSESTNYNNFYTRVIASGGLEKFMEEDTSEITKSIMTPVVAVTSGGLTANSGDIIVSSNPSTNSGGITPCQKVVNECKKLIGWPYVWGGEHPNEGGFDCSGMIDYASRQAGYPIAGLSRYTTSNLIGKGSPVSRNDLKVGDLYFTAKGHVMIYAGNGKVVESPKPGLKVRETTLPSAFYAARRVFPQSGNSMDGATESTTTGERPESIGPDDLLKATYMERKYGPKVYDTTQPLIKFSTAAATDSTNAYDALQKYARFMINYLNSAATLATVNTIAMPWIRPGFNVWIDPVRVNKVYYVHSVDNHGNANGCYTTLNLSLGRRTDDFLNNKKIVGALNPGKSDDIFVNSISISADNFGPVCNYTDIKKKSDDFHRTGDKASIESMTPKNNSYLLHLYGTESQKGSQKPTSDGDKTPTVSASTGKVVNCSELNVRSGPGTNHSVLGTLKKGDTVNIKGESNGWYKIDYKGKDGWVSGKYIQKTSSSNNNGTTTVTVTKGTVNVKSGATLNVRSGPGTKHSRIGSLKRGEVVTIKSESGGWCKIDYKGKDAWASSQYLTKSTVTETKSKGVVRTGNQSSQQSRSGPFVTKSQSEIKNMDLATASNITAADLNAYLNPRSKSSQFKNSGQGFIDASKATGLDAVYLMAHAAWETGWGDSKIVRQKNNFYGIGAYNSSPFASAYSYPSKEAGILDGAKWIRKTYYEDRGKKTLNQMIAKPLSYAVFNNGAPNTDWVNGISRIMSSVISSSGKGYSSQTNSPGSNNGGSPNIEHNNPTYDPVYNASPGNAPIGGESDLEKIQKELNDKYSKAPKIVKDRSTRLKDLVSKSSGIAKSLYITEID